MTIRARLADFTSSPHAAHGSVHYLKSLLSPGCPLFRRGTSPDVGHIGLTVVLMLYASVALGAAQQIDASDRHECAGLEPYQKELYSEEELKRKREAIRELAEILNKRSSPIPLEARQADADDILKKLDNQNTPRFEDPASYYILMSRVAGIEAARVNLRLPLERRPCIGTLPVETVNAAALRIPNDPTPYIVVNRLLFDFVHEMTKLALITLEPSRADGAPLTMSWGPEAYKRQLERHPDLPGRLARLVLYYLGGPMTPAMFLPPEYDILLGAADKGAELFAIAHEYAHLIHGDIDADRTMNLHLLSAHPMSGTPLQTYTHDWLNEIDADVTGIRLTEQALDIEHTQQPRTGWTVSTEFSRRSPLLFLRYADIAREAIAIRRNGKLPESNDSLAKQQIDALTDAMLSRGKEVIVPGSGNDNHPPAPVRMALLKKNIRGWDGAASTAANVDENAFVGLADALDAGILRLWDDSRSLLLPTPAAPAMVLATPGDLVHLELRVAKAPKSSDPTPRGVTLVFGSLAKDCRLPVLSRIRFLAEGDFNIDRPGARLFQEKDVDGCVEAVAAILPLDVAVALTGARSLSIEFDGRQIALSNQQLEEFRLAVVRVTLSEP
jgi:hypothetical protein